MTQALGALLSFPCRHLRFRQQRSDGTLLPCAWYGCNESTVGETYKDRINPPFTLIYERRVTGGGSSPLVYLWRVVAPGLSSTSASERRTTVKES